MEPLTTLICTDGKTTLEVFEGKQGGLRFYRGDLHCEFSRESLLACAYVIEKGKSYSTMSVCKDCNACVGHLSTKPSAKGKMVTRIALASYPTGKDMTGIVLSKALFDEAIMHNIL